MGDTDQIEDHYDEIADEYADFYDDPIGELYLHVTTERMHSYLDELADPLTVLDMGCGQCTVSSTLSEYVPIQRLNGIDISSEMVERARERVAESAIESMRIEQDDITTHEYAVDEYDAVLVQGGVASYVDPVPFLEQIASTLRPGGYGFISIITRHRYALRNLWSDDWTEFVRVFDGEEVPDQDGIPMTPYRVDEFKSFIRDVDGLELVDIYPKISYLNQLPESQQEAVMEENWQEIKRIELENARSPDNYHGTQTEFVVRSTS